MTKRHDDPERSEEYERFETMTKALIAVPKTEIDAAAKKDKQRKARAKTARRPAGYIFQGRFGGHVTPPTIWDWTRIVAQEAGIPYLTTHQLRHTALATANDNLGDLRAVMEFARHSEPSVTAGYTRTTVTRLQDVVRSLEY